MRIQHVLALSLIAVTLGCGGGDGGATTDPSQLKPLTETEKAEIQKQDESIAAEEGEGQMIKFDKKK